MLTPGHKQPKDAPNEHGRQFLDRLSEEPPRHCGELILSGLTCDICGEWIA